ncbi:MAG: GGDEF domain-containing protein [Thermodesulfobacteriota bacterium]
MEERLTGKKGEFSDKDTEKKFRAENWPAKIKPVVITSFLIIAAAFAVDFDKIILFKFSPDFTVLLALKGLVLLTGIFLILFLLTDSLIMSAPFISSVFILSTSLYITGEAVINYTRSDLTAAIMILSLTLFYSFFSFQFFYTVFAGFAASVIYCLGIYFYTPYELSFFIISCILLLITNISGIAVFIKDSDLARKNYYFNAEKTNLHNKITDLKKKVSKLSYEKKSEKKMIETEKANSFTQELTEEFNRNKRYNSDLSLMLISVDKLESLYEQVGNKAADAVIDDIQKICGSEIRPEGDYFARTDENEFCFILPSTDEYGAFSFAERINEKILKRKYNLKNQKLKITISIGIACLENEKEPFELLEHAKDALIKSKNTKGSEPVFYKN